jgi:hypothetical protein
MALLAHQISQPDHFAAVVNAVVVEILEHFAPLQLVLSVISASSCHRLSLITRINTLSVSSSWLSS